MDEPTAKTYHWILGVSEFAVKLHCLSIVGSNEQIELGATALDQQLFGLAHDHPAQRLPAMARSDSEVIDRAAMPIETHHGGGNGFVIDGADQKQLGLLRQLARDVAARIVPGSRETTLLPEPDYGFFVGYFVWADAHGNARRSLMFKAAGSLSGRGRIRIGFLWQAVSDGEPFYVRIVVSVNLRLPIHGVGEVGARHVQLAGPLR